MDKMTQEERKLLDSKDCDVCEHGLVLDLPDTHGEYHEIKVCKGQWDMTDLRLELPMNPRPSLACPFSV